MALFGKNKEEDYDEDELTESSEKKGAYQKRLVKNKDFKDLKKGNSNKRKEPKKPWGRKERLFVFILLAFTTGTSAYLAFSSRSWKLPGLPRVTIPKIKLPAIFQEETIIIEGDRKDSLRTERVTSEFKEITDELTGVYGLYVIRLGNNSRYGVNETEIFQAASLIKLPVIAGMYMEAENGNLNLDEKYTLKSSDKLPGSGSLYNKPQGYQLTYGNLIMLMGKESDNTAFNISRNFLGDERINEIITQTGLTDTNLSENDTTPKDIGNFFQDLWNGNIINHENKEKLLNSLTGTLYENHLVAGVPDNVRVSHKYGREVHVVNDAGIIYTKEPIVVVIMSKGVVDNEADEFIPVLSKMIFEIETADD